MAINYPGPYVVKLFYTTNTFEHVLNLNLQLVGSPSGGDDFSTITTSTPNGVNPNLDFVVDNLTTVLRPKFYSVDATIDRAELWRINPLSFDGVFISSYPINLPGTSATQGIAAAEAIFTFRTQEGGIMKVYLEETNSTPGVSQTYAVMGATNKAIADYFIGNDVPWIARDTSRPISFIKLHPGQNERIFKQRFR